MSLKVKAEAADYTTFERFMWCAQPAGSRLQAITRDNRKVDGLSSCTSSSELSDPIVDASLVHSVTYIRIRSHKKKKSNIN
eukprot:1064119-Pleurochrysis_carterae.AAC.1